MEERWMSWMRGPAGARENPGEHQGEHPPADQRSPQPGVFPSRAAGHVQTRVHVRWGAAARAAGHVQARVHVRWGAAAQEDDTRPVRVPGAGRAAARAPEDTDGGNN